MGAGRGVIQLMVRVGLGVGCGVGVAVGIWDSKVSVGGNDMKVDRTEVAVESGVKCWRQPVAPSRIRESAKTTKGLGFTLLFLLRD